MRTVIPILLYHSISNDSAEGFRKWTLAPEMFQAHLQFLEDGHFTALTMTDLVHRLQDRRPLPAKPIVISFDDGLADFYSEALPILQAFSMPATLYVVSGCVGATSRWLLPESNRAMLTWEQIRATEQAGIEIGAHTHSHPQLDTLSVNEAWLEIARSKWVLEENLGHCVESFAYPHGYHSHQVRDLVRRASFSSACAVKHALSACDDDPFSRARIMITNNTDVATLERLLHGEELQIAPRDEQVRTWLWRFTRRSLRHSQRIIGWMNTQPVHAQSSL